VQVFVRANICPDSCKRGLTSLKLEQLTTEILKQSFNRHERIELWAVVGKSIKHFGEYGRHFPLATYAKILAACAACASLAMAQFVLKIEKLSHIMGTAPIVELARAYSLHPRLCLLRKFIRGIIGKIFSS